jgi:hypothetical protein
MERDRCLRQRTLGTLSLMGKATLRTRTVCIAIARWNLEQGRRGDGIFLRGRTWWRAGEGARETGTPHEREEPMIAAACLRRRPRRPKEAEQGRAEQ